jgi:energy-coupling factor transporter ATP-binding protein EcfA2
MKIRHLRIANFRGIRSMDWTVKGAVTCLVGPGDSTKSTILDAIEFALSPRWNIPFDDSDFYMSDVSNPIEIVATVGQLPESFLTDQKFGLNLRGWDPVHGIHDEPEADDELVLSIRLRVDDSLEPEWTVVNDRIGEPRRISSRDRELLGVARLGTEVDRHLSWTRGSILSRLTKDRTNATAVLTRAIRKVRDLAGFDSVDEFKEVAGKTKEAAGKLGVKPTSDYLPAVDGRGMVTGLGSISIHDGKVPLRLVGQGSRHLIALGLQLLLVEDGAILLIDEVEHALEPHRIRHLLRKLQELVSSKVSSSGQIIMTSHSPTVVVELAADRLCVVRSISGETKAKQVSLDLQDTIRAVPESLLARKVIVCEGKTEYGVCLSLGTHWAHQGEPELAYIGVAVVEAAGSNGPRRASALSELGYKTCLYGDSDTVRKWNPSQEKLASKGVRLIIWDGSVSTEERIALDVSWQALKDIVCLAATLHGQESVLDSICNELGKPRPAFGNDMDAWNSSGISEDIIRKAVGKAAKLKGWFKRIDFGVELGKIVVAELDCLAGKDLKAKIDELSKWIYE